MFVYVMLANDVVLHVCCAAELTVDKEGKKACAKMEAIGREATVIRKAECVRNTEVVVMKNISILAGTKLPMEQDMLACTISPDSMLHTIISRYAPYQRTREHGTYSLQWSLCKGLFLDWSRGDHYRQVAL